MVDYAIYLFTIIFFVIYIRAFAKRKISLKKMIIISLCSAIALVLSKIEFISLPQGGGIELVPMLPVMLVAVVYGNLEGFTCGIIYAILRLMLAGYIISPGQALMDYFISSIMLGAAGFLGSDKRYKILIGGLVAGGLCLLSNILSGVFFYGAYAPKGMNVWVYSIIYNGSTVGVTVLLSVFVLMIIPIKRFKKQMK